MGLSFENSPLLSESQCALHGDGQSEVRIWKNKNMNTKRRTPPPPPNVIVLWDAPTVREPEYLRLLYFCCGRVPRNFQDPVVVHHDPFKQWWPLAAGQEIKDDLQTQTPTVRYFVWTVLIELPHKDTTKHWNSQSLLNVGSCLPLLHSLLCNCSAPNIVARDLQIRGFLDWALADHNL
jgi:hypothetical protein